MGDITYRLLLPADANIHDVFHAGLLKPFHVVPPEQTPTLQLIDHGRVVVQPKKVLNNRLAQGKRELFVRLVGAPAAEMAWVEKDEFSWAVP